MPGGPRCREVNLSLRGSPCTAFHYIVKVPTPDFCEEDPHRGSSLWNPLLGSSRYEGPRCQGGNKRPEVGLGGSRRGGHTHGHSETVHKMSPSAHAYGHANGHSGTSRGMDPSAHAYGWLRPRTGTARPRRPEILFIKKAKIRMLYILIKKAKIRELLAGLLPKEGQTGQAGEGGRIRHGHAYGHSGQGWRPISGGTLSQDVAPSKPAGSQRPSRDGRPHGRSCGFYKTGWLSEARPRRPCTWPFVDPRKMALSSCPSPDLQTKAGFCHVKFFS